MIKNIFTSAALVCTFTAFAITPQEAVDFLYSSMPLPDRLDYSREFYQADRKSVV